MAVSSVREHYDGVLSPHYSRLLGDFDAKVAEQHALLERLGVKASRPAAMAVDLGCGSGVHSIALARLGFRVLAVDFCRPLLAELRERAPGLPVEAVPGDFRDVEPLVPAGADVVVCMGDTLSHLEREADLPRLFAGVTTRLVAGGRYVLSFRDLGAELRDLDRFLPLCASDDVVMACMLEYEAHTVKVHDLIWVREQGSWTLRKGAYRKLRLTADVVTAHLVSAGFTVERHGAPGGMVALCAVVADRPSS
jgi:SAM-dependent methyltransferase